ncbi:hypothetical protein NQ487_28680 [Hungatella hathewayi]|uniref:Uncharacterized protein n=1 Tax=Hungatella hathewayi DSM 13479 TaxID=566550 RepID=D3AAS9_9FIRM|nr:hypothetical protein [Hungatella hathewayi]EFD01094.1 hypothetical protein CLOSTHATH_00700 [Hungatella hathewayi DSM 13479]MBS6756083.1 hypothetical protein [Hungatella hathewayi]MDU4975391.1 hypothetical protein [Hungatella hathewayi]UWO84778.1 hypothetical protein NQ487_28680 [Hungatella hathewayi]
MKLREFTFYICKGGSLSWIFMEESQPASDADRLSFSYGYCMDQKG